MRKQPRPAQAGIPGKLHSRRPFQVFAIDVYGPLIAIHALPGRIVCDNAANLTKATVEHLQKALDIPVTFSVPRAP